MFRSIRYRLVTSYALLTLLTVSVMGVLALSLIRRYIERQEVEYLTANAEAVARQALPFLLPTTSESDLDELVRTASFLGNARVRILDEKQRVVADSGSPTEVDELVWIVPPIEARVWSVGESRGSSFMILPFGERGPMRLQHGTPFTLLDQLPPGTEFAVVRRAVGPWGSRVVFGARQHLEAMSTLEVTSSLSLADPLADRVTRRSQRMVTVPIGEADMRVGYVELSKGPDFSAEALATAYRAFLLAAGGATLLAIIVGLLVGRGMTAPLRRLTIAADQMSSGDLSTRAPARGKDEIGQLARQFNQMAQRLEASFAELAAERDGLRRFIADASHELRTPITALRNFNELLQNAAADDPAARTEFLAESQSQLERMEWITHNLLDLSRLGAGLVILNLASHGVSDLIEAVCAPFHPLAREKGITLSVKPLAQPLEIVCDRTRVELALTSLLDNALKFTPAGGWIEVGAEKAEINTHEDVVRLWVQDSGRGIHPDERERIFERFYRGRGNQTEGSGLGLAIVHSIVQAHNGRSTVESEPGAGSRFVIELPTIEQA